MLNYSRIFIESLLFLLGRKIICVYLFVGHSHAFNDGSYEVKGHSYLRIVYDIAITVGDIMNDSLIISDHVMEYDIIIFIMTNTSLKGKKQAKVDEQEKRSARFEEDKWVDGTSKVYLESLKGH